MCIYCDIKAARTAQSSLEDLCIRYEFLAILNRHALTCSLHDPLYTYPLQIINDEAMSVHVQSKKCTLEPIYQMFKHLAWLEGRDALVDAALKNLPNIIERDNALESSSPPCVQHMSNNQIYSKNMIRVHEEDTLLQETLKCASLDEKRSFHSKTISNM